MAGYHFDPQDYEELQNIVDFASDMVAAPFDASKSYAVGEYCRRESGFYVRNTAGSGAWDASKWTPTTVGDVLKAANAEISTLNSNLTNINARFANYTSGSVNDIKTSGIFFVGNSVTDKPNGTGAGTGGMLIIAYFAADNLVRLFVPNRNVSGARGIWMSGVTGGTALSWTQLC